MIVEEQVIRIFKNNEKYKNLIQFIFSKDFLNNHDIKLPTIKDISNSIGLSSTKVTKLIKELYDEFFESKLTFSKVEIIYYIKYLDNYLQLEFSDLKFIPRVGEQINIDFIKAKIGTGMFYVDKVSHTFENDVQRIYITLRSGLFNSYFHFKKSKAYEQREISFDDYYSGDDYQIREKIRHFRD
mgnify:CR=1 FL=1